MLMHIVSQTLPPIPHSRTCMHPDCYTFWLKGCCLHHAPCRSVAVITASSGLIDISDVPQQNIIERCCGNHQSLFTMLINHIIIILNHIKGNLEFLERCRSALPLFSDVTGYELCCIIFPQYNSSYIDNVVASIDNVHVHTCMYSVL